MNASSASIPTYSSFFPMGVLEYSLVLFLFLIVISFLYTRQNKRTAFLTNWPVFGMIPAVLVNIHRIHDFASDVLTRSGGTYMLKGPWFANMDMLFTTDPSDVHHVLSKNFPNYPKGQTFRKIFDILGDGIFNTDGDLWQIHREITMSLFKHPKFQSLLETTIWYKVERGLLPVLESISKQEMEIDLQEVFQRFSFDTICKLLFDYDPESMSLHFPYIRCEKAMSDIEEAILFRHIMPQSFWKLQQLLRFGREKKLSDAWRTLDEFIYGCLAKKQNQPSKLNGERQEGKFELWTALMEKFEEQNGTSGNPIGFLRDTLLNMMVAGRDTTSAALSWFFYLIAKNPIVEEKIREEIHKHLEVKAGKKWIAKELGKLVYLQGALSEALRLYPPVPFNHKIPLEPEILPSGHQVDQHTKIILSFYSMGRMKSIWGEDCLEFKPERWILKGGGIKHEPSYKFIAFNAGPRTCLGKDMTSTQLKIVASTIIYHYHIELVEGHLVIPSDSIILQMKHGLKVKLTKTNEV